MPTYPSHFLDRKLASWLQNFWQQMWQQKLWLVRNSMCGLWVFACGAVWSWRYGSLQHETGPGGRWDQALHLLNSLPPGTISRYQCFHFLDGKFHVVGRFLYLWTLVYWENKAIIVTCTFLLCCIPKTLAFRMWGMAATLTKCSPILLGVWKWNEARYFSEILLRFVFNSER